MPIIRLAIVAGVLVFAVVGGYFSADPKSGAFLFGVSIMLLLPLTLVSLLDVVRHQGFRQGDHPRFIRVAFSVPLAALALCSAAIGAWLLVPLVLGSGSNTWPNVLAGALLALALIGFCIRLLRVVSRH